MSKTEPNDVQKESSNISISHGSRHRPPSLSNSQNVYFFPMRCNGFRSRVCVHIYNVCVLFRSGRQCLNCMQYLWICGKLLWMATSAEALKITHFAE